MTIHTTNETSDRVDATEVPSEFDGMTLEELTERKDAEYEYMNNMARLGMEHQGDDEKSAKKAGKLARLLISFDDAIERYQTELADAEGIDHTRSTLIRLLRDTMAEGPALEQLAKTVVQSRLEGKRTIQQIHGAMGRLR